LHKLHQYVFTGQISQHECWQTVCKSERQ